MSTTNNNNDNNNNKNHNNNLTQRIRWCWKETPSQMQQHVDHHPTSIIGDPADGWIAYSDEATDRLERAALQQQQQQQHGAEKVDVTCQPLPGYTVHLATLQQVKDATGFVRAVQRVQQTTVWCWQETPSQMGLHAPSQIVVDNDCWIRYDDVSAAILEWAYQEYQQSKAKSSQTKRGGGGGVFHKRKEKHKKNSGPICPLAGNKYAVNFESMTQTKTATGFVRPVQRLVQYTVANMDSVQKNVGSIHVPALPVVASSLANNKNTNNTNHQHRDLGKMDIHVPARQLQATYAPLSTTLAAAAADTTTSSTNAARFLAVIVVHYNPQGYQRRVTLLHECLQRLVATRDRLESNNTSPLTLHICTAQVVYDDDDTAAIQPGQYPGTTCLTRVARRPHGVLWSKEQLINMAWRQLPPCFQKICWIDTDIEFVQNHNDDVNDKDHWASAVYTILDDHPLAFGQMWDTCELLGPKGTVQRRVTSFAAQHVSGRQYQERSNQHVDYWHPGFAWMATRAALEATGGLIDQTLGSADRHMAMSFLGRAAETMPNGIHANYQRQVMDWQDAVQRHGIELLVVPGLMIRHYWHGSLAHRKYEGRWQILLEHDFDPALHITKDAASGLYEWGSHCPSGLMQAVIQYFRDRQEDSDQVQADDVVVANVDAAVAEANATATMTGDNQDSGAAIPIVAAVAAENVVATTAAIVDAFSFYA